MQSGVGGGIGGGGPKGFRVLGGSEVFRGF